MKKLFLLFFICGLFLQANAHDKKTLIERFTNSGCVPCAQLNNAWYNATTHELVNSGSISHIVYNVDWPFANDPMHLLNITDDNTRRGYYAVNAVPWIDINGTDFNTGSGSTAFINAVNSGNSEFSPFSIVLTPVKFSNNVINVHVAINRDVNDVTVFGSNVKLQVGITETTVAYSSPQPNGESDFYSICRKMLPDAKGTLFNIPAPGETTELDLDFIPDQQFLNLVNMDSLRIVAFIQDDDSKEVFQSEMTDVTFSNNINASFKSDETLGGLPLTVNFEDFSTPTDSTTITSWAWDFDNDGNIDSQDENPSWTYTTEGAYTVSLTVSDGVNQYTRTLENYIHAIGTSSDILVVNGIEYVTYPTEMENFYSSSACFGDHQVDVWDLFGNQGFDYMSNPNIQKVDLFNHTIPNSVLQKYQKVIWIGNDYGGDIAFYDPEQVLEYVQMGGNFLLASRYGSHFFNTNLKNYCGITSFTGDLQINSLIALNHNLVDVPSSGSNTLVHFVNLDSTSEADPIFDDDTTTSYIAGFKINKDSNGVFIYIAGRPYRFDNAASYTNYNYIIDNWMTSSIITGNRNDNNNQQTVETFQLSQNYPNPFNPSTRISYSIPKTGYVSLKVYDILGREVATLVNGYQQANQYSVNFDASKLASGIYLYKLKAGDFVQTKKMILMK
jgi:PKD repeat protein